MPPPAASGTGLPQEGRRRVTIEAVTPQVDGGRCAVKRVVGEPVTIETALDSALRCSPDYPFVTEHPGWFRRRPDGGIQRAENPPDKHQDIYPLDEPWPLPVRRAPIRRGDPLWREYTGRHRQNLEHQHHNGGAWPFVGGFRAVTLAALGHSRVAAAANAVTDWQFDRWLHGQSDEPRGMPGQSWNAATFLLAERSLRTRIF